MVAGSRADRHREAAVLPAGGLERLRVELVVRRVADVPRPASPPSSRGLLRARF